MRWRRRRWAAPPNQSEAARSISFACRTVSCHWSSKLCIWYFLPQSSRSLPSRFLPSQWTRYCHCLNKESYYGFKLSGGNYATLNNGIFSANIRPGELCMAIICQRLVPCPSQQLFRKTTVVFFCLLYMTESHSSLRKWWCHLRWRGCTATWRCWPASAGRRPQTPWAGRRSCTPPPGWCFLHRPEHSVSGGTAGTDARFPVVQQQRRRRAEIKSQWSETLSSKCITGKWPPCRNTDVHRKSIGEFFSNEISIKFQTSDNVSGPVCDIRRDLWFLNW